MVLKSVPQIAGFVYGMLALFAIIILWKTGRMNRRIGIIFLFASVLSGFLVFAPVAPYQFQTLVLRNLSAAGAPVYVVISGLLLIILLSFLFGRIFCGNICPFGALQEIISYVPVEKKGKSLKKYSVFLRGVVFIIFLISGLLFSVNLLGAIGVLDFFYLNTASVSFFIFALLMVVSVFVYRPFCRFICPYGVLLSLASLKGVYKFRRTEKCIKCGKCEKVCPVDEAKAGDNKSECYMCGRCAEVCPVKDALVFSQNPKRKN